MKRKLSFKVYLTVLLLLVSFGVRASTVVGSITLEQIEYSLYDDYTAVVSDGKSSVGDIVIPESVEYEGATYSVIMIGISAFRECRSLTSVNLPNGVTTIGSSAFLNCSSLTSVNLPNSVTTIREYAFSKCSSLTSLIIPNSVTMISQYALKELREVHLLGKNPPVCYNNSFMYGCIFYIPINSESAYRKDYVWQTLFAESRVEERYFEDGSWGTYVSVTHNGDGDIYLNDVAVAQRDTLKRGTKITFKFLSDESKGAYIGEALLNNKDIAAKLYNNTYTIAALDDDLDLKVTFKKPFYDVTVVYDKEMGDVTINGQDTDRISIPEDYDGVINFQALPKEGYYVDSILIDGENVSFEENSYRYNRTPDEDNDVVCKVVFKKYLNVSADYDKVLGVVKINNEESNPYYARIGEEVLFSILPNTGCETRQVLLNDVDITDELENYLFYTCTAKEDMVLKVTFVDPIPGNYFTVSSVYDKTKGTVKINNEELASCTVKSGTQVNFSILPEAGYEVQQVLLNDADITADVKNNSYTCTATKDLALEVVFVASVPDTYYQVSAVYDETLGTVRINNEAVTSCTIKSGTTVSFAILPNDGNKISKVLLNDADITSDVKNNTYTCTATENLAFEVVFVASVPETYYQVSAVYDETLGTVRINNEAVSSCTVKSGTTVSFTILPGADNKISNVLLNDADITADLEDNAFYTCTATRDLVLNVTFENANFLSVNNIGKVKVSSSGSKVVVEGLTDGETVLVTNLIGQITYRGTALEIPMNRGWYLVKVRNEVTKVWIE
ncbi:MULTISPECIES: leucine-rich repeat domain-containing protein [unclassified Bacteroides]|jgi:hypothetical protein|uniref:leucine-rich repeat domain-containing protein n=1 Tax=unclassified Bacteroides TaxID=2646097 RepID=UPI000E8AE7CF|nr:MULTISPECIES: leucine-rich repeat domain-containing protein [unclassified Bacteroides]RGN50936.1 leucine-rich repeat domain-containing protein [Bacteroides sp. OM05-12]RHR82223.1 leucine-rich repeat domain-containing protein [Bacteroides sp. AF16-49]